MSTQPRMASDERAAGTSIRLPVFTSSRSVGVDIEREQVRLRLESLQRSAVANVCCASCHGRHTSLKEKRVQQGWRHRMKAGAGNRVTA